jgi:hypothetical protein
MEAQPQLAAPGLLLAGFASPFTSLALVWRHWQQVIRHDPEARCDPAEQGYHGAILISCSQPVKCHVSLPWKVSKCYNSPTEQA